MKVKKFTSFVTRFLKIVAQPIVLLIFKYKRNPYKLEKNKPYIILANHTSQYDAILMSTTFNRPIHYVALETMINSKKGKLVKFFFNPIAKTKDRLDITTVRNCHDVIEQNGVVGLFPSGDCTLTGIESPIDPVVVKLAKKLDCDLIIYRTYGLFGTCPRFSHKKRKGKSYGKVVKTLTKKEVEQLTNEELYKIIIDNLYCDQVMENEALYKSNMRAEYLEKIFYICPDCFSLCSLESNGNTIKCKKCGYETEYGEDLKFHQVHSQNLSTPFETIAEWNKFQKDLSLSLVNKFVDVYDSTNNKIIVTDQIKYVEYCKTKKRRNKHKRGYRDGYISLFANRIEISKDFKIIGIPLKDVKLSYQMRSLLVIYTEENTYQVYGKERFNVLKYIQILDSMKENNLIK